MKKNRWNRSNFRLCAGRFQFDQSENWPVCEVDPPHVIFREQFWKNQKRLYVLLFYHVYNLAMSSPSLNCQVFEWSLVSVSSGSARLRLNWFKSKPESVVGFHWMWSSSIQPTERFTILCLLNRSVWQRSATSELNSARRLQRESNCSQICL